MSTPVVLLKAYKCKACDLPAEKAVLFGDAMIPTCKGHLDDAVAYVTSTLRYGPPDAIKDLPATEKATPHDPHPTLPMVLLEKEEAVELQKSLGIEVEGIVPIEQRDGDDEE